MKKLIRIAAVPSSLDILLRGQLQHLAGYYEVTAVASYDEETHRRIREREGVRTAGIRIERRISPVSDLRSLIELYRFFRREKPDIVHSITPKAGLLSMTAARLAGVPVRIHTFTGLIFPWRTGAMSRLLKTMDRFTCMFASHIIPEGNGVRDDLIKHRITRKPLQVLANGNINGVDTEYFCPVPDKQPNGLTRFVFVGRIVRDKGIEELMHVFRRMKNAELVLLGSFEQKLDPIGEECSLWVRSGEGVRYLGFQQDIRPALADSDVLVLPTYREGFPNILLQAGAMGLPCIATDICGCNEIIVDGVSGLLVEPRNADSLYEAMQRLADEPSLRKKMGANARSIVSEKFSQKKVWNALTEYYRNVSEVH